MKDFVNSSNNFDNNMYGFDIVTEDSHYTSREFDNVCKIVFLMSAKIFDNIIQELGNVRENYRCISLDVNIIVQDVS